VLLEDAHFRLLDASAMIRGIAPPNDYRIGRSERSVGQVLVELGRTEEAIPHFDESLRIAISRQGDRSDGVLRTRLLRASALIDQRIDLEETSEDVRDVAEIREQQALEFQTESAWSQARAAWRMLERIHLIRDDVTALEQVRDDLSRTEKALDDLSS
jgi:tetratricopeptide (TPR) repeat protein